MDVMSDPGFQVDLDDLNTLAAVNIPFIQSTCSDVSGSLKMNAGNDDTVFDGGADNPIYGLAKTDFATARSDLEGLLDMLTSSLADCAQALREIYQRYQTTDEQASVSLRRTGLGG